MPTVGGNNVSYSSGYYEAQLNYTLTYPTSSTYKIDWELRVYHSLSLYDSTNKAGIPSGGDLKGATSYGSKSYSSSGAGYKTYASGTKTGNRLVGSTVVLEQSFWVEDLADNSGGGGRSTVDATITVAAQPVSVPSAPGASSMSAISNSGATQSWAAPASWNGNNSGDYDAQRALTSAFTGATTVSVLDTRTYPWTGLVGNTTYWTRARAKNSAGAGPFGTAVSFLTKPSKPTSQSATNLKTSSVTLNCTAPAGGAASYRLQVATDAGFTNIVIDSTATSLSRSITSLKANTQYWFRWLATNASGDIGWTTASTFTTLKNLYVDDTTQKASVAYYDNGSAWVPCEAWFDGGSGWVQ